MAKANKIMKKLAIFSATTMAVLFAVVVLMSPVNVEAQTIVCPAGYICTPTTNTITPVVADSCYLFTQNLSIGSTGPDVVALQTWLIAQGYDIRSISSKETKKGYFGYQTASALKVYQTKVGIPVTGELDPITREKINSYCNTVVSNITLLTPNGGETWILGETVGIRWTQAKAYSNVDISLVPEYCWKGGDCIPTTEAWHTIVTGAPASNIKDVERFDWVVGQAVSPNYPNGYKVPAGNYYIKVCAANSDYSGTCDLSDRSFAIVSTSTQSSISLTSKIVGLISTDGLDKSYQINLSFLGGTVTTPVSSWGLSITCPSGIDVSTVPGASCNEVFSMGGNVQSPNYGNVIDKAFVFKNYTTSSQEVRLTLKGSDGSGNTLGSSAITVSIPPTSTGPQTWSQVMVISPNGGESFTTGQQISVKWSVTSGYFQYLPTSRTQIYLLQDRSVVGTYDYLPNSGSATITLPTNISSGSQYKISVIVFSENGSAGSAQSDESDNYFTIKTTSVQPTITVLSPNGGENWVVGKTYEFKWKSSNATSMSINLDNLDNGSRYGTVDGTIKPSSGLISWTVRDVNLPTGRYKVVMTVLNGNLSSTDSSDSYFTITSTSTQPVITISSPVSGTTVGRTFSVSGLCTNYKGNVSVYYYSDQKIIKEVQCSKGKWSTSIDLKTNASSGSFTLYAALSSGQEATVNLPFIIDQVQPLTASCYGNQTSLDQLSLTWYAKVSGGTGTYTYSWSAYNDVTSYPGGSTASSKFSATYATAGTKEAVIVVNDGKTTAKASCSAKLDAPVVPVTVSVSSSVGETTVDGTPVVYKISPASVYKWSISLGCSSPVTVSQKGGAACGETTTVAGGSDLIWSVWYKNPTISMQTVGIKVVAYDSSANQIGADGDAISIPPTPSAPMVVAPVITSLSTNSNYVGNQGTITIYGKNFDFSMNANIIITGIGKTWEVFPSSASKESETFIMPSDLPVGSYKIAIRSLQGIMSNSVDFTVVALPTGTRNMFNDAGSSNSALTASIWDAIREFFESQ